MIKAIDGRWMVNELNKTDRNFQFDLLVKALYFRPGS